MLIKKRPDIRSSEITPKSTYLNRRTLLAGGAGLAAVGAGGFLATSGMAPAAHAAKLDFAPSPYSTVEEPTPFEAASTYNNFYEFGTGKDDPSRYADSLTTDPWSVKIDGLVDRPADYALEDLMAPQMLEERIYRLRCVEGWSMVIPWVGVSLSKILELAGPQSGAKYVGFETLVRPDEMRGQRGFGQVIDWPYVEGLRIDEAMHPLTLMAFGMYGETLPNQNGAPMRLVVPWKYGFKSIKSIVRITVTDKQPPSSWNVLIPREYGFYSNVNPEVDHPRWSQATERPIGAGLGAGRKPTLMFNGYGEEVADLYAGMDLRKNF